MNDKTKQCIDLILKLARITEFEDSILISKTNNTISGVKIQFKPELDLDKFPNIKRALEKQKGFR